MHVIYVLYKLIRTRSATNKQVQTIVQYYYSSYMYKVADNNCTILL